MGYTTDLIGHIDIWPPLNEQEQLYLAAFADSRRCVRAEGPYAVPGNPAAERESGELDGLNTIAEGQPSFWCQWSVSWDGEALAHDGVEKFYGATAWLTYLIDHFFAPSAHASRTGLPWFAGFTFDHQLNGTVAAHRRDTGQLSLIRVTANEVGEEIVTPGAAEWPDELLPYEQVRDDERAARRRRQSSRS